MYGSLVALPGIEKKASLLEMKSEVNKNVKRELKLHLGKSKVL